MTTRTKQEILDDALQLIASRAGVLAVYASAGEVTGCRGLEDRLGFLVEAAALGRIGPKAPRKKLLDTEARQLLILAGDEAAQVFTDEDLAASLVVLYVAAHPYVKNLGRDARRRFFRPLSGAPEPRRGS